MNPQAMIVELFLHLQPFRKLFELAASKPPHTSMRTKTSAKPRIPA